jgi:hypothetical protein
MNISTDNQIYSGFSAEVAGYTARVPWDTTKVPWDTTKVPWDTTKKGRFSPDCPPDKFIHGNR